MLSSLALVVVAACCYVAMRSIDIGSVVPECLRLDSDATPPLAFVLLIVIGFAALALVVGYAVVSALDTFFDGWTVF